MKNGNHELKDKLNRAMLVSVFVGSYSFFYISTYPVTFFTIITAVYLFYSFLSKWNSLRFAKKTFLICTSFLTYIFWNYAILKSTGDVFFGKITSALLSAFFLIAYLCSSRELDDKQIKGEISFFQFLVNISAAYAIYQIIGQLLNLPLTDPWIDGHMLVGYNWTAKGTTTISVGSLNLHRAHALFIEPSICSQFLAINILIYIYYWNKKSIKYLILNGLAMILTFSGTGIILLIGGMLYLFFLSKKRQVRNNMIKAVVMGGCVLAFGLMVAPSVFAVLMKRVKELFSGAGNASLAATGWTTSSGFVRFVGVWTVLGYSLIQHPIMGSGIGSASKFVNSLNFATRYTTDNGFVRVCVELGLIGLSFYLLLLINHYKKVNGEFLKFLVFIFVLMNFTNEMFQQNYYWALLYFFNIRFKRQAEEIGHENTNCSSIRNCSR